MVLDKLNNFHLILIWNACLRYAFLYATWVRISEFVLPFFYFLIIAYLYIGKTDDAN